MDVESAWRTLVLLKELNRQNVSPVARLRRVTDLTKPTVVRLLETLRVQLLTRGLGRAYLAFCPLAEHMS
jgi:DNA-binding IclR family transcriptional regulator